MSAHDQTGPDSDRDSGLATEWRDAAPPISASGCDKSTMS